MTIPEAPASFSFTNFMADQKLVAKPDTVRILSRKMAGEGLLCGDLLRLFYPSVLITGQLLVLTFDGKMIIRKLRLGSHQYWLHPMQPGLQVIEWPLHEPLPLVGVVREIVRRL